MYSTILIVNTGVNIASVPYTSMTYFYREKKLKEKQMLIPKIGEGLLLSLFEVKENCENGSKIPCRLIT